MICGGGQRMKKGGSGPCDLVVQGEESSREHFRCDSLRRIYRLAAERVVTRGASGRDAFRLADDGRSVGR
jgi:hypothetical protein